MRITVAAVIYNIRRSFPGGGAMDMKSFRPHLFTGACVWFLACGLVAAQQVTIARDASLHAEPNAGAAAVGKLRQGEKAEQIGKQGAWVNVKAAAGTGWLYSFNVTYATSSAPGSGGGAAATPERRAVIATIGIRGLEEEDLRRASFDGRQMDLLDGFAATRQAAEAAAARSGLTGR